MHQVTFRALALLRRPAALLSLLLLSVGGSALVLLPVLRSPGFELGLVLAIATGILGGIVGGAAGFQESRMLRGRDPRPVQARRLELPMLAMAAAFFASLLALGVALLIPFLTAIVTSLVTTACDPLALIGFYPLLTLGSAAMASAAGVFASLLGRRVRFAVLIYVALLLGSLIYTAWPLYFGPQVFASNVFLGYLPGPLYDEALQLSAPFLWSRLEALLAASSLVLLGALMLDLKHGQLSWPRLFRPATLGLLIGSGFSLFTLFQQGPELGLRMTDERLAERLGGTRTTEHFQIHYPRGMEKLELDRLTRDLEFRRSEIAGFLDGGPTGTMRVWIYRSDEEKRALVGAGRTQFAKPWRLELHVSHRPFPHSILPHELAHVMAAPFASGPFKVPARFGGIWPVMGITEGFAVAADGSVQSDLTLHQWAAGMRRQELAPDLRSILGPEGFYANAPGRAYTLAGSFLRWLKETRGSERMKVLYAEGSFESAYETPLNGLVTEWESFLDSTPLDDTAIARAFARFREKPLFARSCGREVARLEEEARLVLASDPERALELYSRTAALQPEEHSFQLGKAQALTKLERYLDASEALKGVAEQIRERPALVAEVALAQADLALLRSRPEEARSYLQHVLGVAPSPDIARTAQVKLAALDSAQVAAGVAAYFDMSREDLRLLKLQRALLLAPQNRYINYLLGRRLGYAGAPDLAGPHLARTLEESEEPPISREIQREAWRLRLETAYLAGDCATVRSDVARVPAFDEAFSVQSQQWVTRCDFEDAHFGGPLRPNAALVNQAEAR